MKNIINGLMALCLVTLVGCAGGGSPAVGAWDIAMNTPIGDLEVVLTINEDGTGTMSSDALGEAALSGIVFDGNAVNFAADIDAQGQTLTMEFSGSVEGDVLEGEFGTDFGALSVSGNRQ
ncbi:MAG: hypothetical protein QGG67_20825 [Gammaproteobacteria bacterium]|jgi:hypothetical protein|nr:hypothetical protein [Gammaproteobacteria bacterium]MDP6098390.1 hypothetical protein [Gammaproteobacteria bacterium]HJO11416.1 hypothetical protein [Gammaproteobacteria bacterium]|tara:strand:- start:84 stop:443 length:360 start_codon:yes stop_codon:yes gene_type:complete